jgi:selenide, water dikinase
MDDIKLTQFSHGAGCGCKISPAILDKILHSDAPKGHFPSLLVGNESKDDAAVFDLGDGTCIISTTDFFMPIVDDPFTFGAIASVNAISDVYAMGGEPLMAIAILGWPINTIPPEIAKSVLEGSKSICGKAGIPLAGGHSIDCPEPVFGLAVTGKVRKENLKRNDTARPGSVLYLTKALGIGIVTTAQKKGIVKDEDYSVAVDTMLALNSFGGAISHLDYVNALTDVTGFGLLGHLKEMCEGSNVSAEIYFEKVPRFSFLESYIQQKSYPGGTTRNWESYGKSISGLSDVQKTILADPQTSGGLLISVKEEYAGDFEAFAKTKGLSLSPFGRLLPRTEPLITVI